METVGEQAAPSAAARRAPFRATALAAVLLLAGLSAAWAASSYARAEYRHSAQDELDRRAAVAAWALNREVRRYQDTAVGLAAALSAQQDLRVEDFTGLAASATQTQLTGASGVAFVVSADDRELPGVSAFWQSRGSAPLVPGPFTGQHLFTVFTAALDGGVSLPSGRDLAGLDETRGTMAQARRSGRPALSESFVLLRDRHLPPAEQQQSILLAAPVYAPEGAPPEGRDEPAESRFRGWLLLTCRSRDLAVGALTDVGQGLVNVALTAPGTGGVPTEVVRIGTGPDSGSTRATTVTVPVLDRQWTLTVRGTARAEAEARGRADLPAVLGIGGAALSLLLALLAWTVLSSRDRARAQVAAATVELRLAEAEARGQAGLLDAIVGSMGDGVGVVDASGTFVLQNSTARRMFGADPDHLHQQPVDLFLADGSTPFTFDQVPLVRALQGENSDAVDMVVRRPGQVEPVTITITARPLPDAPGLPGGGAVAVFHDVSRSRELQRQVAQQNRAQQSLLTALSDMGEGVVITERGRLVHLNEAYARLVGYPAEELMQLQVSALPADPAAAEDFGRLIAMLSAPGCVASPITTRLRHRNGRVIPVEATGISVDRDGVLQRVCLVRDLSEQVAAAAELTRRAEALQAANADLSAARDEARAASQAKSDFVAHMSHELRTPLNGVIGLTNLLTRTELSAEQRQLADTAARSGATLLQIVDDILDFSKIEAGRLTVERLGVDVPQLLGDLAEQCAAQAAARDLDLLVDVPPLPALTTDPVRLRQVLTNLLGNALKFTSAGHVTLAARAVPGHLLLSVTDSGPGISAEAQGRLFSAFEQADSSTTRRYGGTGLGLAISRRLAQLLDGTLTCSSEPGSGSTFTLTLPLAAQGPPHEDPPLPALRVAVLAATPALAGHLRDRLVEWGAVVSLDRVPAPGEVDVAVLDMRSPDSDHLLSVLAPRNRVVVLRPLGAHATDLPPGCTALTLPLLPSRLVAALQQRPGVPSSAAPAPTAERPARPLHVLVADDNEVNRLVATLMLDQLGHTYDVVDDGRQAVEAALDRAYDVVLMDCQMPVLDGLGATRELRRAESTRYLPVVALTAGVTTEEREACRAAGMDGWLSKPLRLDDLREHLAALALLPVPG